ncbi:MAG: hypothetical protein WA913_03185 [Pricia sp.]
MEIDNLMDHVRNFFSEQYKGVEKSNSFLSFEALGTMIDPNDFIDENDEISEIKATEQLSILGDRLPEIDDIFLTSTSRLSTLYKVMIEGAQFCGDSIKAEDLSPYLAKFGEVRSDAVFKFNEAIKASIERPEGDYLPVYGSPNKWYDPEASFWQTKMFSTKEDKKLPPDKNPSDKKTAVPLLWKTKLMANPEILKTQVIQAVKLKPLRLLTTANAFKANPVLHSKPQPMVAVVKPTEAGKKSLNQGPFTVSASSTVKTLNRPNSNPITIKASGGAPIKVNPGQNKPNPPTTAQVKPNLVWSNLSVLKHLDVAERSKMTSQIARNSTVPEEPVRSNGFEMSFDYCIVNLDRGWYDTTMFHYSKLWYSLSLEENYFSTGTKNGENSGSLKCIPTAMILIKDLKIKAAWTNEDKQNAKNSVGLGIFNLSESTFTNDELNNPGMQIIGWMCEVLPRLPENSDPHVTF